MGNSYWPKTQEKGIPHVVCGCLFEKEISRRRRACCSSSKIVFCQVMLGFQQDVSSDIKARFTLAINTIKTVASNIMEKLVTLEP